MNQLILLKQRLRLLGRLQFLLRRRMREQETSFIPSRVQGMMQRVAGCHLRIKIPPLPVLVGLRCSDLSDRTHQKDIPSAFWCSHS